MSSTGISPHNSVIRNSITCKDIPPQLTDMLIAKPYFARFGKVSTITLHPTKPSCTVVYENTIGAIRALEYGGKYFNEKFRIRLTHRERDVAGSTTASLPRAIITNKAFYELERTDTRLGTPLKSVANNWKEKQITYPVLGAGSRADETLDQKILKARNDLHRLGSRPAYSAENRYQVLEAKDRYIRLCLQRTSDTRKFKPTKETCSTMCPEKEIYLRQWKGILPSYERQSGTGSRILIDPAKAIKQYSRVNTDSEPPLPHELRTEQALGRTMHFLLANVVPECDTDKAVTVIEWFTYIFDRTRSIRKDIVQQNLCSQTVVTLMEQCARFHIHCAARLAAEESSLFDQPFNTANLTYYLKILTEMYAFMEDRGEPCSNEAQFRAYFLLLNLNDDAFSSELRRMSSTLVRTPEVQFAMSVHAALTQCHYVKFFELVRATNYMNACIMHRYFTQVRVNALSLMRKAYSGRTILELAHLTRTLCFEDEEDAQGFFEYYHVDVSRASGTVVLEPTLVPHRPGIPYWNGPAIRMVARKRISSVAQTICGEPLDLWGTKFPLVGEWVSSFDSQACLRKEILVEILGQEDESVPSKAVETTKPASMPACARKPMKRIERTKIFNAVIEDTFFNDKKRLQKSTEIPTLSWNFSSQQNQAAENKRSAIGEENEVIDLDDSDSDECIPVLEYKLSDVASEKVPQEKIQLANMEHLNTEVEHKDLQQQRKGDGGKEVPNKGSSANLVGSISDKDVWARLERGEQKDLKSHEIDLCTDSSSNDTTAEDRDQTKHANRNHLGKGKEESQAILQQQYNAKILQSPVEMKQRGDANFADLPDYEDLQCMAMDAMGLEEQQHVVVEPQTKMDVDLFHSISSNEQMDIPSEREEDEAWNNLDVEKKQHEQKGQRERTAAPLDPYDAWIGDRFDSTSSNACPQTTEGRDCTSPIHFEKQKEYDECELLQEHVSVSMEQANDNQLSDAASACRNDLEESYELNLLEEHIYKDIQQTQECVDFVDVLSTDVTDDDLDKSRSPSVDIQVVQKHNGQENRPHVEKEDEHMQPKAPMLSVDEESTHLLQDEEEAIIPLEERRRSVDPVRRFDVELIPHDVQESTSSIEDILELPECDNHNPVFQKEEKEDETQQPKERRCSNPLLDGQSDSTSNSSGSEKEYDSDKLQKRDQSNSENELTNGASTDDQDDSSSITERSSASSLNYFASTSSISIQETENETREEEKKLVIKLQKLMPPVMQRSVEATLDDLLDSTICEAMREITENEIAWQRLIEIYSDKMLSELETEVLVELIAVAAREELEERAQARRKRHLLAYKYWHRWVYNVRIAARFRLLVRSVSPTRINAHPSHCQQKICDTFGKQELIDPFAVLDCAVQSNDHLRAPFYWKLVISLCSTDTNDTFGSFNSFVDCWLRNGAFKRDPDYELPDHAYLFYAARAVPAMAAICMRLVGDGSAGHATVKDRKKASERSNGFLFIMHNYEPIARVRERLRRLLSTAVVPPPAIAVLHFCPSRCDPVNVGKGLELDKETARWKVFQWRHKADNDPLRAASIFLAGCYRDQLQNAFDDPERLEMCSLISFLHNSVGPDMWFSLVQVCCMEAAVMKDGPLCKLARDGKETVRRFNEALRRVGHMVARQEIPSFTRIAEEFDLLRAHREGRAINSVSEASFPPDWHSAERRHQIEKLLDGLQLHAPPDHLLAVIVRAARETVENGRVHNSAELQVALDCYLSRYGVFAGNSLQREKLLKELAPVVESQLSGCSFPVQTEIDREGEAMLQDFSWVPLLARVADSLMHSTVLAMKLPFEVCYRRGELRRYLRTAWGIQQYIVSQASSNMRSTSTTIPSPSIDASLPDAPGTSDTSNLALYTTTPNQKRQATTPINSLGTFAAKRTMKDNSGSS